MFLGKYPERIFLLKCGQFFKQGYPFQVIGITQLSNLFLKCFLFKGIRQFSADSCFIFNSCLSSAIFCKESFFTRTLSCANTVAAQPKTNTKRAKKRFNMI